VLTVLDSNTHTFEASHQIFRGAFPEGFPWEVLEVYSSPPFVCFSWRHWAYFNGIYKEKTASNNDLINMYGFATVSLDENSKICDLKILLSLKNIASFHIKFREFSQKYFEIFIQI